jgi:hypothetical protein
MKGAIADDENDDFERFESVLYIRSEWTHFYILSRRLWRLEVVWYDRKLKGFHLFELLITSVVTFGGEERG